jgi:uncharacterized protein (DUF58 family)
MPFWSPRNQPEVAPSRHRDLFDEAFQKRLELLSLVTRRVTRGRQRGERRSAQTGAGIEFADHRDYSAGDDYRHIDWNAYARVGRLLVRLYEQPADLSVHLLIDHSGSMGFGQPIKLDYAKKLAAALAYVGLRQLDRVGVSAFSGRELQRWKVARGRHNIFGIFQFLTALQASGPTDLAGAMQTFVAGHRRPGMAILISDLYDPVGFERAIDVLRYARFETHVLQVVDSAEWKPALHGDIELCDVETGVTRAITATPDLLARYAAARIAAQERLRAYCADKRVSLFTLQTSIDAEDALLRVLQRGGMLR